MTLTQRQARLYLRRGREIEFCRQHKRLADRRLELDRTIEAIHAARTTLDANQEPDRTLITQIIRRVGMQNDTDWTAKYFNDETKAKVEERKKLWSPEFEERVTREWNERFHDIDAALNEDPAGAWPRHW